MRRFQGRSSWKSYPKTRGHASGTCSSVTLRNQRPQTRKKRPRLRRWTDLAREGARRLLMAALQVEVTQYVDAYQEARATRAGGGWWSATVRPRPGRSRVGRAQWRCARRGCTTSGSMPRASASGSPAGSFRPTCAGPPRWPRCCRFSLSAGCPRATSAKRCPCCWETTRPG